MNSPPNPLSAKALSFIHIFFIEHLIKLEIPHYASFVGFDRNDRITNMIEGKKRRGVHLKQLPDSNFSVPRRFFP